MKSAPLIVMNNQQPTHKQNVIDLTFASPDTSRNITNWRVHNNSTFPSDHNLITFEFTFNKTNNRSTRWRWKLNNKELNWIDFTIKIEQRVKFEPNADPDTNSQAFTDIIYNTADRVFGHDKNSATKDHPWWNFHLQELKNSCKNFEENLRKNSKPQTLRSTKNSGKKGILSSMKLAN